MNVRRSLWPVLAAVGLASLQVSIAAAQAPREEFRIVFPSLWNDTLDPILTSGAGTLGLAAIYDDLVGAKPDGSDFSKTTGVAEDWMMSPDGKTWTLKIRHGIQFHRGFGELTGEDVKYSLERVAAERSTVQMKAYFKTKVGKIEVPDPYTVVVHAASDPIPDFLTTVSPLQASPERFVVSKKAIDALGEEGFSRNPVGSGPYEFIRHIGGQSIELKAVPNHWRLGTPRFAKVMFVAVPEEETSIAMLQRGDVDMAPITLGNIKRLQKTGVNVMLQKSAYSIMIYMDDQFVESVAVHNPKVREALNLAIDRQALVDTLFEGQGRPLGTYWVQTPVLDAIGYDWKADLYPYDPKRARALLAEAGFPNGVDLDVYVYPYVGMLEGPDTMQAVIGMWSAIGVRPKIIATEYGVVRAKLVKGEMPGGIGYFPIPARPWQGILGSYRNFMHSNGTFGHVKIPELDKLLDDGARAVDPQIARGKLIGAMKFVRANHLAIPLLEYDAAYALSPRAKGWDPGYLPNNLNFDSLFRAKQ
jgi:peptide/nickel transport system substrate-binding protein